MSDANIAIAIILTTLIIIILIAVVVIAIFIVNRQRTRQQMQLAYAHVSYLNELRKVEVEISERMMEKFAQELHDNISHKLTYIRLDIENRKIDKPELERDFSQIELYLDDATKELKLLSQTLNTEYISNIGLIPAINIEVERVTQLHRMKVSFTSSNETIILDKDQELMAFRIFQEILQNTLKHSCATLVEINLNSIDGFTLNVSENGIGFNLSEVQKSGKASGITNMYRRASMSGLKLDISSSPNRGCAYILKKSVDYKK